MTEPIDLFRHYYQKIFNPRSILIPSLKFRHFRFQIFSGRGKFLRLRDVFTSKNQLYQRIARIVPFNAYFTPTRWLSPIFVSKTKGELDVMLYSSLYFDVDSDSLRPSSFEQARITTTRLIEQIDCEYGRSPDLVVFSGRRGFHVYYWDWDTPKLREISPQGRIENFIIERKRILRELYEAGTIVDERVTVDPYRIMRIPNTLHGKTGLIARNISDLKGFDPLRDALAFDLEDYSRIMKINLPELFRTKKGL